MQHLVIQVIAVMMMGATLAIPSPKLLADPLHADPNQPITVTAAESIDQLIMWRAVAAFRQAGLDLPPVSITVHDDPASCGGNRGRFTTQGGYAIQVCARHANPRVEMRWRLRTALHELAHAYTAIAFVEDDITTFMQINDVRTWLDRKAAWEDRGTEIAAESLIWGLGVRPDVRIEDTCDELLDNFLHLTHTQPVAEAFQHCEWAHLESGSERLPRVDIGGGTATAE